jgi:hypothetical protein
MIERLQKLGLSTEEALQLRRISMTLHRWYELECGDSNDYASWSIERDEATNKPYKCIYPHDGKSYRYPTPDLEAGAHRRLAKLMKMHPDLTYYCQTDPRGASLYILRTQDIEGQDIQQVYTRGVAVYK